MYDARTNLSADVAAEVRNHLGSAVFDTVIPRSVRLSEAPSFGLPIALYSDNSRGAVAYAAHAAELRHRDGHDTPIAPTDLGSTSGPQLPRTGAAADALAIGAQA